MKYCENTHSSYHTAAATATRTTYSSALPNPAGWTLCVLSAAQLRQRKIFRKSWGSSFWKIHTMSLLLIMGTTQNRFHCCSFCDYFYCFLSVVVIIWLLQVRYIVWNIRIHRLGKYKIKKYMISAYVCMLDWAYLGCSVKSSLVFVVLQHMLIFNSQLNVNKINNNKHRI